MQQLPKKEQLERLVMGLRMSIQNTSYELELYEPGTLEHKYAVKFLGAVRQHLERTEKELTELEAAAPAAGAADA